MSPETTGFFPVAPVLLELVLHRPLSSLPSAFSTVGKLSLVRLESVRHVLYNLDSITVNTRCRSAVLWARKACACGREEQGPKHVKFMPKKLCRSLTVPDFQGGARFLLAHWLQRSVRGSGLSEHVAGFFSVARI